jgi:hypothetical protein
MRLLHHLTSSLLMLALLASAAHASERPTFNKDTCDPRPDIAPYWLHDWYQGYRRVYNRPRYLSGKIAHVIEPVSQEAMVWQEAKEMGLYNGKNCPPVYKRYNYPRPWEILQTGPRADFTKPNQLGASSSSSKSNSNSDRSPSDQPSTQQPSSDQPSAQPSQTSDVSSRNRDQGNKLPSLVQQAKEYRLK